MVNETIDVLVVGAGPVGLFCANELSRHGLSCRIIEKKSALSDKSKALGIHIRTLDVLQDCGFYDEVIEEGHVVLGALLKSNGKQLAELNFEGIGASRNFLIDLPQDKTERILYKGLVDKKIAIEWQSELLTLEQFPDEVIAGIEHPDGHIEKIRANWLIACDGAHSTARQLLKAEFIGASYAQTWWLADLHINWSLPQNKMIINASEKGPLACFPMGDNRYRIVMTAPANHHEQPDMNDIVQAFNERTSDEALLSDPVWITAFSIHHKQIQHYRDNRVFFCGDAAHIHSPMGGQGLNTGIQDAYNLVWKLALVQKKQAKDNLLNSYHDERYPIGKSVLKKTDIMTKMILIKTPYLITLRNHLMSFLSSFDFLRKIIAKDLAELKISYAKSPIVKTLGEKTDLKTGQFVPNFSLKNSINSDKKSLADISQGTLHHLFLFAGLHPVDSLRLNEVAFLLDKFKDVLTVHLVLLNAQANTTNFPSIWIDENQAFHDEYKLQNPTAMLVRPDKYIGLTQSPINFEQLQTTLNELL
ncbi:MAG: FAD-dependent oxidoreductase [Legionella sp.]|nr:FAD-dependent oxidoreductase [Legionella sp.]